MSERLSKPAIAARRVAGVVGIMSVVAGLACSSGSGSGSGSGTATETQGSSSQGSETTTTTSAETGTETETGAEAETSGLEPDLPPYEPCECEPGTLCVADCEPGGEWYNYLDNFRCVGPPECRGDPSDPVCVIAACEYSVATTPTCNGETYGTDIICNPNFSTWLCQSNQQDCPVDDKCVLRVIEFEQLHTGRCVLAEDPGAAVGEPCSSEGVTTGIDDCGLESMCWNGEVSYEPFAGTCHAFCAVVDNQINCPAGSKCEPVGEPGDFYLCVPTP